MGSSEQFADDTEEHNYARGGHYHSDDECRSRDDQGHFLVQLVVQVLLRLPVLNSADHDREGAQGGQKQADVARAVIVTQSIPTFLHESGRLLENLVDRKPKTHQREASSDPCHQRPVCGHDRAMDGEVRSLLRQLVGSQCGLRVHVADTGAALLTSSIGDHIPRVSSQQESLLWQTLYAVIM